MIAVRHAEVFESRFCCCCTFPGEVWSPSPLTQQPEYSGKKVVSQCCMNVHADCRRQYRVEGHNCLKSREVPRKCFQLTLKEITLRSEKSNGPKLLSEFHRPYRVEGQRDLIFSKVLGSFALLVCCPIILILLKMLGLPTASHVLRDPWLLLNHWVPRLSTQLGNHVV